MNTNRDDIDCLFDELEGQFDVHSPSEGHQQRFEQRLKKTLVLEDESSKVRSLWKPLLLMVASVVICFGLFTTLKSEPETNDLASVSQEMAETQDYFHLTLAEELKKLNAEVSPLTEDIIYDAMRELKVLETQYTKLKTDLKESGQDKRVVYAMISNFQTRIDILTNVLEQIENIKELNTNTDVKTYTL
ncbi:hypothetical protein Q2T40_11790 [Winogradskyella maritima]|uniref:DUF4179 domain-containing protein n=1 Tax=Winogradskyella maritima TaxID=1517766 RepID=A0ABV8AIG6_9FLAO|nr:hypothetical protein [Winogradskyella maritima]